MLRFLIMLMIAISPFSVEAQIIDKERSIYRNIIILEQRGLRCMRFESRGNRVSNQACIDLSKPDRLVFEYAHGVLAGYSVVPNPKRILIIGLGGGVLSTVMHELSPEAEIVTVDIDPAVFNLAKKHFNYKENDKIKTEIKDGRVYIKRALLNKEKFDWIILDAFNGDYIPEHLMTKEFLTETKALLSEGGLLTSNTFSNSELYDYESATYQDVFKKLHMFKAPKGNRVIYSCNCDDFEKFPELPDSLKEAVTKYEVDLEKVWTKIRDEIDWNTDSEILTDQYSPANLLKQ